MAKVYDLLSLTAEAYDDTLRYYLALPMIKPYNLLPSMVRPLENAPRYCQDLAWKIARPYDLWLSMVRSLYNAARYDDLTRMIERPCGILPVAGKSQ